MKYTCPISFNMVDHNVIRLVGFFTLILILISLFNLFGEYSYFIMLFLFIDFIIRIFNEKFSILKIISKTIMHDWLKIKPREVGASPKRFAAGIGALFSILIFLLILISKNFLGDFQITKIGNIMNIFEYRQNILYTLFIIAVSLETFFGYCLGCKIYSIIQFIKNKIKKTN